MEYTTKAEISPDKSELNRTTEASADHNFEENTPEKQPTYTNDDSPKEQNPFTTQFVSSLGPKAGTPQ
jgi:hypothetical protein